MQEGPNNLVKTVRRDVKSAYGQIRNEKNSSRYTMQPKRDKSDEGVKSGATSDLKQFSSIGDGAYRTQDGTALAHRRV